MIDIKVKSKNKQCEAYDIEEQQLFMDDDGDLFMRAGDGAILLDEGNSTLTIYSIDELQDYEKYPSFKNCYIQKGKVSISVEL